MKELWSKVKGQMKYIDAVRMAKEQGLYDAWLSKHGLSRAPKKRTYKRKRKGGQMVQDQMGMGLVEDQMGMGLVEGGASTLNDLF